MSNNNTNGGDQNFYTPPPIKKKQSASGATSQKSTAPNVKRPTASQHNRPMTAEEKRRIMMWQARKKQVRRNRIIAGVILSTVFVMSILVTLSLTVWFPIRAVVVRTTDPAKEISYTLQEVSVASGIVFNKDNIFRCNTEQIADNIEKALPYVGDAVVSRKLPGTLVVSAVSTEAIAAVENGRGVLLINNKGKILESVIEVPNGLKTVTYGTLIETNPGEIVSSKSEVPISVFTELTEACITNNLNKITNIDISSATDIKMTYDDRIVLKLGNASDINDKIYLAVESLMEEDAISQLQTGTMLLDIENGGKGTFAPYADDGTVTTTTISPGETTQESIFNTPTTSSDSTTEGAEKTTSEDDKTTTDNDDEETTMKKDENKTTKSEND